MHHCLPKTEIMEEAQATSCRADRPRRPPSRYNPLPAAIPKDEDRRHALTALLPPARRTETPACPRRATAAPMCRRLAARIEDDRNLTDGARRCARKLTEYIYRNNRESRERRNHRHLPDAGARQVAAAPCSATCASSKREGYIGVEVIHARTRMCAGLLVELLAPLFPRHHRQKWPQKLIESDAPRESQNNRLRYKYSREFPRCGCVALYENGAPPPAFPITV